MGLPVRGQRNRSNAKSAKRLNKIERRGFATQATASFGTGREESRVLAMLPKNVRWD
jgi:hypothetical protein